MASPPALHKESSLIIFQRHVIVEDCIDFKGMPVQYHFQPQSGRETP